MKNDNRITLPPAANDHRTEPALNLPPVTKMLCLSLVAVFLIQYFAPEFISDALIGWFSFVPARLASGAAMGFLSLVSYMFLHGGWLHLAANVGMLMAFGAGLEKAMGARAMLGVYFLGGIGGALVQFAFAPQDLLPLIGASGGVSGLFGALVLLMQARGMMGAGYRQLLPMIGLWVGLSVFFGMFGVPGAGGNIAWVVHIGGFFAGMAAYFLWRPRAR